MKTLVVKVGGSLLDWPALGTTLSRWLRDQTGREILVVAGGGPLADAVRRAAERHRIDDEQAHWLAIQAMQISTSIVAALVGSGPWQVVEPLEFCRADDKDLPHSWDVTSDSIAGRLAEIRGGDLVLLKSADPPPGGVNDWAAASFVDRHFPKIVARAKLTVRAVNLRTW